jgi:HSP20 family protein
MKLARRERQNPGLPAPLKELNRIRDEIGRIFDDPFSLLAPSTSFFEGWAPTIDVYEDKDSVIVKAALPGMKKEDIEISLEGSTLTISGERKQEEEKNEGETYRSERYFGRFQRSLTLPTAVDPDKIQASYKDGVLTVSCAKSEDSKPKQIQVKG